MKITNDKELLAAMQDVACTLAGIAGAVPPYAFKSSFGSMIPALLGALPEDYFNEMIKVEPCGVRDCDCHLTVQVINSEFYKAMRKEYQEQTAKHEFPA